MFNSCDTTVVRGTPLYKTLDGSCTKFVALALSLSVSTQMIQSVVPKNICQHFVLKVVVLEIRNADVDHH